MKICLLLFAISSLVLSPARAGETLGVNVTVEKRAEFDGREIAVNGLVDRVSAARRMVVLIDASEATCQEACDRKMLVVQVPEAAAMPVKGSFLKATGTLAPGTNPPQLVATQLAEGMP